MDKTQLSRFRGFEAILKSCLRVGEADEFLLIYDESFRVFCSALTRALRGVGISSTFIFVPKAQQRALVSNGSMPNSKIHLPSGIRHAISTCSAILFALQSGPETSTLRKVLLNQQRAKGAKLVHVPGLTDQILRATSEAEIEEIGRSGELLGWALGEAQNAEIETKDRNGSAYKLEMRLDGWDNEPFISSGQIPADGWGNIPPGEVFICPSRYTVNGSVCIRGSTK